MKTLKTLIITLTLIFISDGVNAALVIDQENSAVGYSFCTIRNFLCGQSFQQDRKNISGAGIFLATDQAGSGNITISIYENYSTTPSGLIASGTSSLVNQNSGWIDLFWTPAAILPSTTYYMVLENSDLSSGLRATYSPGGDTYLFGTAVGSGNKTSWPTYDLNFRTYASVVPIPSAVWLFGSGLLALISIGRQKARG